MSSGVEGNGVIAAAVVLPIAAALGAGWLAWQGGKLLVEANMAANRKIEEKKLQLAEEQRRRKMAALSAHRQMVDMCTQILQQLERESASGKGADFAQLRELKLELEQIRLQSIPEETERIENLTADDYRKMERIIRRHRRIAEMQLEKTETGLYHGISVADLMDDLGLAVQVMEIVATRGGDVVAADPKALERVKLNKAFTEVSAKIIGALEEIKELTQNYGLSSEASAWFHRCFDGLDTQVEALCRPTTSNEELEKGVRRLEEALAKYNLMAPSIQKKAVRMARLYQVYAEAAEGLGEKVLSIREFKSPEEIEEKLKLMEERVKRARECAEIYQLLGPEAYICYAWDQELQKLGYKPKKRKEIEEMAKAKTPAVIKDGEKIPIYHWKEDDLTKLYSLGKQCAMQIVVHKDGSVSMQTIAETESEETVSEQRIHCEQLRVIYERLRENWFILYDYKDVLPPETVTSVASWRQSDVIPVVADKTSEQQDEGKDTEDPYRKEIENRRRKNDKKGGGNKAQAK